MKKMVGKIVAAALGAAALLGAGPSGAALVVPTDIEQPGTQPREVGNLESPDKCDNCHGGYNAAVEPAHNWRGSMMANAGRDPIFWATLAIAEQDFTPGIGGAGDLCIRCHSTGGWYGGRSTPTDGSGLSAGDADGVDCDTCHKMTNPDNSDPILDGTMFSPYLANDEQTPATGYYGSGMLSLWGGSAKLGPYSDDTARHQSMQSTFHRSVDFCGSCHDVSNPAVGDLAHNAGAQPTGDPVVRSGVPGSAVNGKAAFNNFPYQYGIVERTYSEYKSGLLSKTRVSQSNLAGVLDYTDLPAELKAGAIKAANDAAKGNYSDGTPRYFSCQTCHMRAVTGQGCNKNPAVRTDLPLHDMTGGNTWMPDAILDQNMQETLRLGGGLTQTQISAIQAGKTRALEQLRLAASLSVSGNTLTITNLTGHKLISGYPEGRRMWLNIRWFDAANTELTDHEIGKYDVVATVNGTPVKSIVNLDEPTIYEAHYAMTKEWANQLLSLGYSPGLVLSYDRVDPTNPANNYTLGQLAAQANGTYHETFHFVLNNHVAKDNRIPPYGMSYEEARVRNALPVPASQYGSPGPAGAYNNWDQIALSPPDGAIYATIDLKYQTTSWEYIQFLFLANEGSIPFLANEGSNLLDTWIRTGMSEPVTMASATWGTPPAPTCTTPGAPQSLTATAGRRRITLNWQAGTPAPDGGYRIYYNQSGKLVFRAGVGPNLLTYTDSGLSRRTSYSYVVRAWQDCNGNGVFDAGVDLESTVSNTATATAQ